MPNSYQNVICKIKPIENEITSIIGIKYEVFNVRSVQYVDKNGNGFFYNYENICRDYSLNKKEKILLSNIKIYDEIPLLEAKLIGVSNIDEHLELFENQYYKFSFLLENIGNTDIHEMHMHLYAFKKDDYKVSVDELYLNGDSGNYNKN